MGVPQSCLNKSTNLVGVPDTKIVGPTPFLSQSKRRANSDLLVFNLINLEVDLNLNLAQGLTLSTPDLVSID